MKTLVTFFCFFALSSFAHAQFKFEKNGVIITTTPQEIKDKNSTEYGWVFELAQIKNTSEKKKKVSFHVDMYYDGICSNCTNNEYFYTFNLAPGEIIKGNIFDRTSSGLKYFKEDKGKRISAVLSDLQFTSFTVE
jgi:hypothetical protein